MLVLVFGSDISEFDDLPLFIVPISLFPSELCRPSLSIPVLGCRRLLLPSELCRGAFGLAGAVEFSPSNSLASLISDGLLWPLVPEMIDRENRGADEHVTEGGMAVIMPCLLIGLKGDTREV